MSCEQVIASLRASFEDRLLRLDQPTDNRLYLSVDAKHIVDTARFLGGDLHCRLQTVTGLDGPQHMEMLYHWAADRLGLLITVRTLIPRDEPKLASISKVCPAATWIERELWELLGVGFDGHPDITHLLLADDWPQGQYPLRRDFRKQAADHEQGQEM